MNMKLSELFEFNKYIVINTDIDGFLSGMLLQKYYGCKVVGFTDSKLCVWLSPEINSIKKPIYIDLYIADPEVVCIDNHIIAFNSDHSENLKRVQRLREYGILKTKWNPNLDRNRNFKDSYRFKYPFGTVHYLIALMALDGIHISMNDLTEEIVIRDAGGFYSITRGMILLRADDALNSSLGPYRSNCSDWWEWMEDEYNSEAIYKLREYLYSLDETFNYNNNILDRFFLGYLKSDGRDGSLEEDSVRNSENYVSDILQNYAEKISQIMNMELDLPGKLDCYKGQGIKDFYYYNNRRVEDDPSNYDIFSYAYVSGKAMRSTLGPMQKI